MSMDGQLEQCVSSSLEQYVMRSTSLGACRLLYGFCSCMNVLHSNMSKDQYGSLGHSTCKIQDRRYKIQNTLLLDIHHDTFIFYITSSI